MVDWRPVDGLDSAARLGFEDGKMRVEQWQDEQPIVEHVKEMRERAKKTDTAMGRYVGSIPITLYNQWVKEDPDIAKDNRKLLAKLQSADFSKLRV